MENTQFNMKTLNDKNNEIDNDMYKLILRNLVYILLYGGDSREFQPKNYDISLASWNFEALNGQPGYDNLTMLAELIDTINFDNTLKLSQQTVRAIIELANEDRNIYNILENSNLDVPNDLKENIAILQIMTLFKKINNDSVADGNNNDNGRALLGLIELLNNKVKIVNKVLLEGVTNQKANLAHNFVSSTRNARVGDIEAERNARANMNDDDNDVVGPQAVTYAGSVNNAGAAAGPKIVAAAGPPVVTGPVTNAGAGAGTTAVPRIVATAVPTDDVAGETESKRGDSEQRKYYEKYMKYKNKYYQLRKNL